MLGCSSHQPDALTCHSRRGKPADTGRGGVAEPSFSRRWPAVMTPRLAGLRADDVVASHRAADGAGPSIEPGRTYAHGTSRGAVAAVSCVWPAMPFLPARSAKRASRRPGSCTQNFTRPRFFANELAQRLKPAADFSLQSSERGFESHRTRFLFFLGGLVACCRRRVWPKLAACGRWVPPVGRWQRRRRSHGGQNK